ncbi:MAG: ABC transporter permease [Thermoprotei archaeon]
MLVLGFKMFLRMRGLVLSILSVGFLIAILVATSSVVNYVVLQAQMLGGLISPGDVYIVVSRNSTNMINSRVDVRLVGELNNVGYIRYVLAQKVLVVNLTTDSGVHVIYIRGVDDVGAFLRMRGAYLNGSVARGLSEYDIGELVARLFSIRLNDNVSLSVDGKHVDGRIVGVFKSRTQNDAELIVPMEVVNKLIGDNSTVSLIEFALKDNVDSRKAISEIVSLLPGNVKLVHVQELKEFVEQMNVQMLDFLNVWSIVVYVVVVGVSYIISMRLVVESSYELFMFRVLGARRFHLFGLIVMYTVVIVFLGTVFGIALGVVGVQMVSTFLRWFWPSIEIAPFFDISGVFQTIILSFVSAILGCIYPAFKYTRVKYMEQHL